MPNKLAYMMLVVYTIFMYIYIIVIVSVPQRMLNFMPNYTIK